MLLTVEPRNSLWDLMYLVRVHIKDRFLLSERTSYVHIILFITLERPSFMFETKGCFNKSLRKCYDEKGPVCQRPELFCIAIRICGGSETWYPIRYRPEMSTSRVIRTHSLVSVD
ncbi:predicted protein [Coccidioides posadasii str. Silveira]|uniref:Predicted protein n=2 Tax=Coccidioides posadasii TaxID=199306 RepID=E9CRI4_COCPS|nr:predicted protein [Coccidioides posadasii str. Silveira]KMM68133.1 hypothetical protein CPAG_04465 [Coccidioides posadasii RMSCC 3488]